MEIWKTIKDFEDYQVSNLGNVKMTANNATRKERILKPLVTNRGYYRVALYKDKKPNFFTIHRLVAIYFIDNPENKSQVNHKDGNKENNIVSNLEWMSNKENSDHAYNTGLKSKESLNKAFKIKSIRIDTDQEQNHYSINQAAKDLNLYPANVWNVLKGNFKQSGGYRFEYL